jgi:hypothetical protein
MFCRQYAEAIQELADGTLGPVRRAELQTHLDQCDNCRALAADLQKIRDAARAFDRLVPPDRVWLQIAGQLRQEGRVTASVAGGRRRAAIYAIAAALLLMVGGSVWLLYPLRQSTNIVSGPSGPRDPGTQGPRDPSGNAAATDPVQSVGEEFRLAEQHLQAGIAKLEAATKADPDSIDPETAATLERNLAIIDRAIAESRTALKEEPQSAPARDSLFDALRRKVSLLQDTIALMNEMRKGNSAGAAQIIGANKS